MTDHLVLLPGGGQLPEVWAGVINRLPAGVAPKLPMLQGGLTAQREQLQDYLQKHELTRFYLGGHGTGAMVALQFAAAAPHRVRGLVLSNPQLRLDEARVKQTRTALKLIPKFLLGRRGASKAELLGQLDDAAALNLAAELKVVREAGLPVQLLTSPGGEEAAREVAAELPAAELTVIEAPGDAGPAWFEDKPEVFGAAVGRLLD